MKKFRGKALATLLSLALIASSLPVTLASASSKTVSGVLSDDPKNDEFWLVNGGDGKDDRSIDNFETKLYDSVPLETIDHHTMDEEAEVSSISHVSGDRLVSWDIDDDGKVKLSLRKSDSEGDEVIAVLYKGTYTDDDDDDTEYTVKASTEITIHAVDENSTVIGDASKLDTSGYFVQSDGVGTDSPELEEGDDDFALKTTNNQPDSKVLAVFKAERANSADKNSQDGCLAVWEALKTKADKTIEADGKDVDDFIKTNTDFAYVLEATNDHDLKIENTVTTSDAVVATVDGSASTANITFKAKVTDNYSSKVADDDEIKAKVKIAKKIIVNDELTSAADDDDVTYYVKENSHNKTVLVTPEDSNIDIHGGYEVDFETKGSKMPIVNVKDDADIDSITGTVQKVTIDNADNVDEVDLDKGSVYVTDSDVKIGNISTGGVDNEVSIDANNSVGDIDVDDAVKVTVTSGSTGDITTDGIVEINASEDDEPVSISSITAKDITLNSEDGAVSVGTITSSAAETSATDTTITLIGDQTKVKAIDFSYYPTDLQFEDYQGEIPAPTHATADGATLETTDPDDDVTVTGNVDIDSVTVEDESEIVFDGSLDVDNLDGSGTMYIGANDLYVGEDASDVLVKITGANLNKGDTIFTADSDAVDEDDLDFFGFTVKKDEGKNTDKFVVDELNFAGLALNKTSSKIVLGDSETFTASAYAPGTSLPDGYSVEFDMDDNSGVFELVDNGNGTATVKVVDYDETFSDENKATLRAYVVDEDGDEDDDYDAAECDLTALKTPEVTWSSDTNNDFTLAPGASYQFKITANEAPVMTAGTAGVLDVTNVGKSGNDYFIKVTAAADAAGKATGVYVNGAKLLVVNVEGAPVASFTSDTTADLTVKSGNSYVYKITASSAPTFTLGSAGVFNYTLVSKNGNDYFYKITAVGAAGSSTGVYVNGQKVNVAKVG